MLLRSYWRSCRRKVARETQRWQGKHKSGKGNSKLARETQKWQGKLKSGKGNSKVAREAQKHDQRVGEWSQSHDICTFAHLDTAVEVEVDSGILHVAT